jgi:hypothetical protein
MFKSFRRGPRATVFTITTPEEAAAAPAPEPEIQEFDGVEYFRVDKRNPDQIRDQRGFLGSWGWNYNVADNDKADVAQRIADLTGEQVDFDEEPQMKTPLNNATYQDRTVFTADNIQSALNFALEEQANMAYMQNRPFPDYYMYRIRIPRDKIADFEPLKARDIIQNVDTGASPDYASVRDYMDNHDTSKYQYNNSADAVKYRDARGPTPADMRRPLDLSERLFWGPGRFDDQGVPLAPVAEQRFDVAVQATPFQNEVQLKGPIPLKYISYQLKPITFDVTEGKRHVRENRGASKHAGGLANLRPMARGLKSRGQQIDTPRLTTYVTNQMLTPEERKILNIATMQEAFPQVKEQYEQVPDRDFVQLRQVQPRVVMNPTHGVEFSVSDIPESEDSDLDVAPPTWI